MLVSVVECALIAAPFIAVGYSGGSWADWLDSGCGHAGVGVAGLHLVLLARGAGAIQKLDDKTEEDAMSDKANGLIACDLVLFRRSVAEGLSFLRGMARSMHREARCRISTSRHT